MLPANCDVDGAPDLSVTALHVTLPSGAIVSVSRIPIAEPTSGAFPGAVVVVLTESSVISRASASVPTASESDTT